MRGSLWGMQDVVDSLALNHSLKLIFTLGQLTVMLETELRRSE